MPRDDGFAVADTATGKLDDPKFRKLWRIVHDGPAMNAAVVLHDAVQLASWAAGERVTAEDAAPFWMEAVENVAANLQAVGLLDKDGRLPAKAWESWFGAARDRRQKRRDAGQLGGRPKPIANHSVSDAEPLPTSRITTDNPVPSVPFRTVPSVRSDPLTPRASGFEKVGAILPDVQDAEITPDVVKLQKLAEELTGQAYVMHNVHGGLGAKAVTEQLPHGFDRVQRAWRQIANRTKAEGSNAPTLRQLVFGADDILNPIPNQREGERAERVEEEERLRAKREKANAANLRYLRGESA